MDADDAFNAAMDEEVSFMESVKDNTCIVSQRGHAPYVYNADAEWTNVWAWEVGERAYVESMRDYGQWVDVFHVG